ncbi:MAG: CHASE2 domain-containing protein [Rhodospirillaceae bacterium]|nr:CHASE2 domain-containing protein [Rhodospirillaceae bacterium]
MTTTASPVPATVNRMRNVLFNAGMAVVLSCGYLFGAFAPIDRFISDLNFSTYSLTPKNDLLLVNIDSRSLKKLNKWPWSRAYHAALIAKLVDAGADTIAFDIDFSSESSENADGALAQAIQDARGRIVLAAFFHASKHDSNVVFEPQLPLPVLQQHAQVGFVNTIADPDGRLRSYRQVDDRFPGAPTTMVAIMAQRLEVAPNSFYVDYGIDMSAIPRLSYVDVLTGNFDPAMVRERKVLVGAAALELGDRFAVPRYGFLYGAEIQALAYQSLVLNRTITKLPNGITLLGIIGVLLLCRWLIRGSSMQEFAVAIIIIIVILGTSVLLQRWAALNLEAAPLIVTVLACVIATIAGDAERHARDSIRHWNAAQRQRQLIERVFSDSSDGILICDESGIVQIANAEFSRLMETETAAILARPIQAFLPGLNPALLKDFGDTFRLPTSSTELTITTPSGKELALLLTITIIGRTDVHARRRNGIADEPGAFVITVRDESKRRAIERDRERVLQELKATTAAKSAFLARMSHELRTPLSAIIGFSEMIRDQRLGAIGNEGYLAYASDIHDGGRRLLALVNDVLDVVRIEANEFTVRPDIIDLQRLLAQCAEALLSESDSIRKSAEVYVDSSVAALEADPRVLAKAIKNLLSNAVKFTKPDGSIIIRAYLHDDGWVAISVEDDGVGMDEATRASVLAAFAQGNGGLNRSHEGAGLGLYIANRLVELHGGHVDISSELSVGTTVTLKLPQALLVTTDAYAAI